MLQRTRMILGLSRAELGLTVFIVALVYAAVWVPRLTEKLAIKLASRGKRGGSEKGGS
jgi:hypothetical protein